MGFRHSLAIASTLVWLLPTVSLSPALAARARLQPLGLPLRAISQTSNILLAQDAARARFRQLQPQLETEVAQLHPDIVATRVFGSTSPDYGDYVTWGISVTLRDGLSIDEQADIARQVAAHMVDFRLTQEGSLFPQVPNLEAVGGLIALFELSNGGSADVPRAAFSILSYDLAVAEVFIDIRRDGDNQRTLIGRVEQTQFTAIGADSPDPSAQAEQLQAQGEAQYQAGDLAAARLSLEEARDRFQALGNLDQEMTVLDRLVAIYDQTGVAADTALTRQGEIALALRDPLSMRRIGFDLHCRRQWDEALALYRPAREQYRRNAQDQVSLQETELLLQELWTVAGMAQVLIGAERFAEAETVLREGILDLEAVFEAPLAGADDDAELDRQISRFADFFNSPLSSNNLYLMLQQVLLAQGKTDQALVAIEQGRTKALEELWAVKQPGYRLTTLSLDEIRAVAQRRQATLVTYSFDLFVDPCGWDEDTEPDLLIWVVSPEGDIQFKRETVPFDRLPGNHEDLQDLVAGIRSQLGARGITVLAANPESLTPPQPASAALNPYLRSLHDLLIEPIADSLSTDPTDPVIFVPDYVLFLVPFAALQADDGSYLIDHHTPITAPSIQALQLTEQSRQQSRPARSNPLIVGNPTYSPVELHLGEQIILPQLPGAEQEALDIAEQLGVTPLIGAEATKTAILERISDAGLIHFATHGLLETGLLTDIPGAIAVAQVDGGFTNPIPLAGTNSTIRFSDNGLITTKDLLTFRLQAELVVLSACNTGGGDLSGDGVTGLSRAFIAAGVPSLIVSLWSVPDAPTGELMAVFYEEWLRHGDKAQALRQAMLAIRDRYPNPINWAAFTLIGESE